MTEKKMTAGTAGTAGTADTIIRTKDAGVFFAKVVGDIGDMCHLVDARRVWYWAGAATLSELAIFGTAKPEQCKFPIAVPKMVALGVIEVIPMTPEAIESLANVPVWSAR